MTDPLTQLLSTLPPEAGPFLLWAAANFDVFRPAAILVSATFLLGLALGARWVWRRVQG